MLDENEIAEREFFTNPKVDANYDVLQEIGAIDYIDRLNKQIRNYNGLLSNGLDIFNHTTIDGIIFSTVWQISDHFLPSFIAFLWKPTQNKEIVTVKAYRNNKPADLNLKVSNISSFENFFRKYPRPINFDLLSYQLEDDEAVASFKEVQPELFIPILGPMGLYGIIIVGHKMYGDDYSRDELIFLQKLMAFVSQAIKNHLHYEHTLRDAKTGLYNHGFFLTRLEEEIARSKRMGYASSMIVLDVDKFKNFNDTYGHLAGDQVLERLAFALRQGVRNDDIPSRFGGEEFTVLLPNTDTATVWQIAERLRTSIASMEIPWKEQLPQVTISLGIFTFDENCDLDATEIIHRADAALYVSKETGRNRCTVWSPDMKKVDSE